MTSFVHLEYSRQHPGVARVESALDAAQHLRQGFSGTRGLATLLLSAIAAAVLVVAYQVMDSVAEGHLLVIWIAMWAAAFAVLALFAGTARRSVLSLKAGLDGWSRRIAERRADARLWALAQTDARVMTELQTAQIRGETPSMVGATVRKAGLGAAALRAYQRNYI